MNQENKVVATHISDQRYYPLLRTYYINHRNLISMPIEKNINLEDTETKDSIPNQLSDLLKEFAESSSFTLNCDESFFQLENEQSRVPPSGLKIHVALRSTDASFLEIVKTVAQICGQSSPPTKFKVMRPSKQLSLEETDSQKLKMITIYPNCEDPLSSGSDYLNVKQTTELVTKLKDELEQYPHLSDNSIEHELPVANGLFLRPGKLSSHASFGSMDYSQTFTDQLEALYMCDEIRKQLQSAGLL